jgi:transglutaminase-like putative cysteine protease
VASADPFLARSSVVDFDHPAVAALAQRLRGPARAPLAVARACFEWVRDAIPHSLDAGRDEVTCSASEVLRVGTGLCYAKSHLLVALLRANALPAAFVYQRLALDERGEQFCLHGLAAVRLPSGAWYRVDPRGNKATVDAQFTPPVERLAFAVTSVGEYLAPGLYAEPLPLVVGALRAHRSLAALLPVLPDAAALPPP